MSIQKPSKEFIANAINQLSALKEYKGRLLVYQRAKDTDFWKSLKSDLEMIVKNSGISQRNQLRDDSIVEPSEIVIRRMARLEGNAQTAESMISQVEEAEKHLDSVDSRIHHLEEQIKNAQELVKEGVVGTKRR